MEGRVVVITGTSSGIGKCLACRLVDSGATVIGGCRSIERNGDKFTEFYLDLSSFESVLKFYSCVTSKHEKVDVLINNAAYMGPKKTSTDGHDYCFQVNYLSHFLLTLLFLNNRLKKCQDIVKDRLLVINVTSDLVSRILPLQDNDITSLTNRNELSIVTSYANSKLCLILFSDELNRKFHGWGIDVLSIHPGRAKSDLQKHWPGFKGHILRFISSIFLGPSSVAANNIFDVCSKSNVDEFSGEVIDTFNAICQICFQLLMYSMERISKDFLDINREMLNTPKNYGN